MWLLVRRPTTADRSNNGELSSKPQSIRRRRKTSTFGGLKSAETLHYSLSPVVFAWNKFYLVVGQAMRQRRTSYVPPQAGRTRFRPRRSHRLVLSANIGMILRTQTPSAIGGHAHTDSFGQQRQRPTTARESYTFFILIDMMQAPK